MIKLSGECRYSLAYHVRVGMDPDINLILSVDTPIGPRDMTFQGTLIPLREDSEILKVASLTDGCINARDIEDILAENERLRAENNALQKEFANAIRENDL